MSEKNQFHIPSLDGIRGVAASIVFVSHAALPDLVPGGFGVTIFFFLSGYLITTLLRMEYANSGGIRLSNFYLRRIYRILPPMYIVLIGMMVLALAGIFANKMTAEAVLAQFAHLTNYYLIFAGTDNLVVGTAVMWSLAVEEHFYLVFPLVIGILFRRLPLTRIAAWLLVACGVVLAWRCYLVMGLGIGHEYTYHATDTRLDSLLYGCILAVWMNPALDQLPAWLRPARAVALVGVSTSLLLFSFLYRSETFRETWRYTVQGIALFPLFLCAVRYSHWPIFSWLESRPMRALGLISYTFYLVHIPCIGAVRRYTELDKPLQFLLSLAATVAISAAMYFFVERHMGRLRRRLHTKAPVPSPALPTERNGRTMNPMVVRDGRG